MNVLTLTFRIFTGCNRHRQNANILKAIMFLSESQCTIGSNPINGSESVSISTLTFNQIRPLKNLRITTNNIYFNLHLCQSVSPYNFYLSISLSQQYLSIITKSINTLYLSINDIYLHQQDLSIYLNTIYLSIYLSIYPNDIYLYQRHLFITFTQPLRSGRIWHNIKFLSGV